MPNPYFDHGKRLAYQRGCRCDLCKAAQRAYSQNYWATHEKHRITRKRRSNGVMHEFEVKDTRKPKYEPSDSRGVHDFERRLDHEPEYTPPDTSFASYAKRRQQEWRKRAS
jgi:hypothetical protein